MARSSSCRPEQDAELFWATIGGMGLTGVILDVTIDLIPIETSRCAVDTDRAPDLDALLGLMEDGDRYYRYSVAWIDLMARGRRLGRSVLTRGEHAEVSQLRPRDAVDPLAYEPRQLLAVPPVVPARGVVSHLTMAAFNEAWFRKAPVRRVAQITSISRYFHPLDFVGSWNRLYGGRGFLQYQFVVPFGEETTLRRVVERLAASGTASFLAVLKRFGPANPAPLSFPRPGLGAGPGHPGVGAGGGVAVARAGRAGAGGRRASLPGQGRLHDSRRDPQGVSAAGRVAGGSRRRRSGRRVGQRSEPAARVVGGLTCRTRSGEVQTIVLLGGGSEIGRAIVEALVSPSTRVVVLAARRPDECPRARCSATA